MANVPPALEQLLAQSVQRGQYQNPLFQATSNQAFAGLPSYARQGLTMPSSMPPVDLSGSGMGGGASAATALGSLSPAILAAAYKAYKAYQASQGVTDGSAAEPYSKVPGAGSGGGNPGGGGETGGFGDYGVTTANSNATTSNTPTDWDSWLRILLGMDPGSGGANASGESWLAGGNTGAGSRGHGQFGGGPQAR